MSLWLAWLLRPSRDDLAMRVNTLKLRLLEAKEDVVDWVNDRRFYLWLRITQR